MSKTFSIAKAIDTDKLDREIERYEIETGNKNIYVFMNYDTIKTLENQVLGSVLNYPRYDSPNTILSLKRTNGLIGYYQGYKCFRDDTLCFGEVEIR